MRKMLLEAYSELEQAYRGACPYDQHLSFISAECELNALIAKAEAEKNKYPFEDKYPWIGELKKKAEELSKRYREEHKDV